MNSAFSTEPITTSSDCTPQQARYAKLLSLSTEELNAMAVRYHRMGGHVRLCLAEVFLAIQETAEYKGLGASSVIAYARKMRYEPSTTFEYIRIARKLLGLPITAAALEHGDLSWSDVAEVSRVAEEGTEQEWVDFAKRRSFKALKAEVQYALKKKRKLPRADSGGLPRLRTRMIIDVEPEEKELIERAMHKMRGEMAKSLPGQFIERKHVFLHLSELVITTDPADLRAGLLSGRVENGLSPFGILFNRCVGCRKDHLVTADGLVEVPSEVLDRIEGDAHRVEISLEEEFDLEQVMPEGEIDRPNTASFVKKVAFRDGLKCANPHCQRRDHLHSHHLIFRSKGGRTVLINSILLCKYCHACVHQGLLVIEGNPLTGLTFTTRADKLNLALEAEKDELVAISQIGVSAAASSKPPEGAEPPAPQPSTSDRAANLNLALGAEKDELGAISQLGFPAVAPQEPVVPAGPPEPPPSPAAADSPAVPSAPSPESDGTVQDPLPATPEATPDLEHEPPRPRWGVPGHSGILESKPVRPPSFKVREADLRLAFLALKKLGYTAAEATERVGEAVRRLEGRKGPVRAEEVLRAALGARLAVDE